MLEYASHGAPSDCVFIHGAGGNNLLWKRTLQYLSGPGKAQAVNLPGHPDGDITCRTVAQYADSVRGFMKESNLGKATICGHSMGSAIALTLALEHPEIVQGLILVGGGAKLGVSPAILQGLSRQPLRAIEELITPMSFDTISIELGREARVALSLSNLRIFLNDYMACNGFDVRGRLSGIFARTLAVCGETDHMTPPKYSHFLGANISDSVVYVVRGAGHMVPLEKPEPLGSLIQTFLSGFSR